jgi:hypothetical protein
MAYIGAIIYWYFENMDKCCREAAMFGENLVESIDYAPQHERNANASEPSLEEFTWGKLYGQDAEARDSNKQRHTASA